MLKRKTMVIMGLLLFFTLTVITIILLKSFFFDYVDYISTFVITGRVYDSKTKSPLSDVNMVFLDLGLDEIYSRKQTPFPLKSQSDKLGEINTEFTYWWGFREGLFYKRGNGSFAVVLYKEGYKRKRLSFRLNDLVHENNKIVVPLNNVYLESEP